MDIKDRALLIDITRCAGCRACMDACMESHGFTGDPYEIQELSANANTVVLEKGDYFVRRQCMHCLDPSCASVCPVGALQKTDEGPVVYDSSRCIGCRYCMQACPFSVPRYEWNRTVPSVVKCDGCIDRVRRGDNPACAEACPAEGTLAGTREELLREAHRRIEEDPDSYYPHIYGEKEVGGTSVLVSIAGGIFHVGIQYECRRDTPSRFYTTRSRSRPLHRDDWRSCLVWNLVDYQTAGRGGPSRSTRHDFSPARIQLIYIEGDPQ